MRTTRVIVEAVNAVALGVWAGMLAFVGVAAAFAFPAMKRLDPSLPAYAAYEGEHWRLAAGSIMNPLFGVVRTVGLVVLVIALGAAGYRIVTRRVPAQKRWCSLRNMAIVALAGLTMYVSFALWGPMIDLFEQHSAAALAGDNEASRAIQTRFNELHDLATPLMAAQLLFVLGYLAVCLGQALRRDEAKAA